jgi:hypothetical protein
MLFSLRVSGFPDVHPTWWLALPFALACLGTWDTTRCLQRRWSFYHGGVLLLIYVDLMVVIMIAILILAPFSSAIL